jgi:formamidopyrimidine-DNA glycosylase
MPELPEVENFRQLLEERVAGKSLCDVTVHDSYLLKNCSKHDLLEAIVDEPLESINRRGKYLLLSFPDHTVVNHLRMSGRWALEQADRTRLSLVFPDRSLHLEDLRRLGTLHLFSGHRQEEFSPLENLGIEPLSEEFTIDKLDELCSTMRELKRLLLDQKRIAGLGNIYSCESLFRARLHPERSASTLERIEVRHLRDAIRTTLREAIAHEGTTFDGLYQTADGTPGQFQHQLNVYDREDEACYECGEVIERFKQGQRSTYYCERCQE